MHKNPIKLCNFPSQLHQKISIIKDQILKTCTLDGARVIETASGLYRGVREKGGVEVFKAIKFASQSRFMPPSSFYPSSRDIINASKFAPVCPQVVEDADSLREYLKREEGWTGEDTWIVDNDEDCLFLNIHVPILTGGSDTFVCHLNRKVLLINLSGK